MADDVRFDIRAQDRTRDAFASVDRSLGALTRGLGAIKVAVAATFVAEGVAALIAMEKAALDTASAIADVAAVTGVGTTALQELRHAADMSGVSTETLDAALGIFTKNLGAARNGTGSLATYLGKLDEGLLRSVQSAGSTEAALDLVLKRMGETGNASDAAALSVAAFGRSGVSLTNLTKQGSAALAAMRQEANDLGIVLDENLIAKAEEAGDQLSKMEKTLSANFNRVLISMAPTITSLGNAFALAAPKIAAFVQSLLPNDVAIVGELQRRLVDLNAEIAEFKDSKSGVGDVFAMLAGKDAASGKLAAMEKERAALERLIAIRQEAAAASRVVSDEPAPGAPSAEKALEVIAKRTAALQLERDSLGLSAGEKERLTLVEAALTKAREDGLKVMPELIAQLQAEAEAAGLLAADLDFSKQMQSALTEATREAEAAAKEAASAQKQMADEGKRIAEAVDPMVAYANQIARLDELLAAGAISGRTFALAADEAAKKVDDAAKAAQKAGDFARDMGLSFSSAFEDAIVGGAAFSDVLRGLLQDILRITTRKAITEPLGNAFSGLLGGIFSSLPGFASGGGFEVGGGGAVDSQVVAFRATPGERVSISPPGQAGGGGVGSITYMIDARGAEVGVEDRIRQVLAMEEPAMRDRAVAASMRAVEAGANGGGPFAKAVGRRR